MTKNDIKEMERNDNQSRNSTSENLNIDFTCEKIHYRDEVQRTKNQSTKKSGCVCTCCHKDNFERKSCVISEEL